jgi:hypothetical protein
MKLKIYLIIMATLFSCSHKKYPKDFKVTTYLKVSPGYHYSNKILRYEDSFFRPLISSFYNSFSISNMQIYKSEGIVNYNKGEIQSDSLLKNMYNITEFRKIELNGTTLFDNGRNYIISKQKDDSIFCLKNDTLLLYNITSAVDR